MNMQERIFTGRDVLDFRGDVAASQRANAQAIPPIGTIILYGENEDQMAHENGCPGKSERGVGRVKQIVAGRLLIVEVFVNESYRWSMTFRISDIAVGLIQWVPLKELVYTKGFRYADYDLKNPHPDIKELIISKEEIKDYLEEPYRERFEGL